MFNTGTDIHAWFVFVKSIVVILLFVWLSFSISKLIKKMDKETNGDAEEQLKKREIKSLFIGIIIKFFLFVTISLFLFVFFGKGEKISPPPPNSEGYHELIEQNPDMPSPDSLKKEAENLKPDVLKRQDSSFLKEKEEADKALDEMLRRADSLNNVSRSSK